MTNEKIEVCYASKAISQIQPLLDEGWKVKFAVAESVSVSTSSGSKSNEGKIVFILSK